jgi:imidazolonepropionase-like amidohydrolase
MNKNILTALAALVVSALLPLGHLAARQMPSAPVYAIQGARIVSAGEKIDKGNLVMKNGLISEVGADAAIPSDAVVVDGSNMTVYPGLIDMTNTLAVEPPPPASPPVARGAAPEAAQAGGRGRGPASAETWADADRIKREELLHPDFDAADHVRYQGADMQRLAAAGITTVLAVSPQGLFRGTSALVNVVAPPDQDDVSRVAGYRRGDVVVVSPVAEHVTFTGRVTGPGYPEALLGNIAFVRQTFYDAEWQKTARAWADRHKDQPRPDFEPALDALAHALDRKMPVSFEGDELRQILRGLKMAKEFNLDPIITGGIEADQVIPDLKAANAKVILTLAAGSGQGASTGSGQGRGGAEQPLRVRNMRQNMTTVPAALDKAGVLYAFSSEGLQNPSDFLRAVGRDVHAGGLTEDEALRALTVDAAKIAGASDRVGTLAKGKIANVLLVDGDLFSDQAHIRQVFVDGRPADINVAPNGAPAGGRRGGGH